MRKMEGNLLGLRPGGQLGATHGEAVILSQQLRHGLVVRIAGSHPAGPGSIPGGGTNFLTFFIPMSF